MAMLLLVFATALLLHVGVAQVPIPGEPPGFTIGRGSGTAKVQLETYIDLLCPFSKAAYNGVKALADHYEPEEFRVKAVLFPLPFHQHGFTAAESVFTITSALGDDHFTPWLGVLDEGSECSASDEELKELAKKTFPALTDKQWEKGMTGYGGTDADQHTRVTWKYACTRTVTGTPQYTLNGVPFEKQTRPGNLRTGFKIIDPLVKADKPKDDL
ncbi:Thioredoxin-like fold [Phytophthora cactorum]|nr:Thioredoxin-like fold [Phytophthora cactorum]